MEITTEDYTVSVKAKTNALCEITAHDANDKHLGTFVTSNYFIKNGSIEEIKRKLLEYLDIIIEIH